MDFKKLELRAPEIGIGIDIEEIQKFKRRKVKSNRTFYKSIYTESELKYSLKYSDPYPHLAGIFAAKEATIKCLDKPLRMRDIEIIRNIHGKPFANTALGKKAIKVMISISHTRLLAVAVAIYIFQTKPS